ncbi:MAG: zinc ribbon domain-containing protein [Firmicutes bacterium]|nr:zinc ribbon domain-containing protein [Bacillota bacterium]
MYCPRCGAYNETGKIFCQYCSFRLPLIEELQREDAREESLMEQLKEVVDSVIKGGVDIEAFAPVLEDLRMVVEEAGKEMIELEISPEISEEVKLQESLIKEGLNLISNGISEIASFSEHRDSQRLKHGIQTIEDGNFLLNKAIEVIRSQEGGKKLEDIIDLIG